MYSACAENATAAAAQKRIFLPVAVIPYFLSSVVRFGDYTIFRLRFNCKVRF
jgi:hypothetical protein